MPLKNLMIGNRDALLNARINGVNGVPIFESGASTASQVKFTKMNSMQSTSTTSFSPADLGAVELTASIIDFLAVRVRSEILCTAHFCAVANK